MRLPWSIDPTPPHPLPATAGTRNVLDAANRTSSVRRVVLTSSIVAIYGDAADIVQIDGDRFDESHWNATSRGTAACFRTPAYDFGISLSGSTKGRGTTTASRSPSAVATRTRVPISAIAAGTIA